MGPWRKSAQSLMSVLSLGEGSHKLILQDGQAQHLLSPKDQPVGFIFDCYSVIKMIIPVKHLGIKEIMGIEKSTDQVRLMLYRVSANKTTQ